MKVGDVIKFGRVPFKVKESSVQRLTVHEDSPNKEERTFEKNITDVESMDEHDFQKIVREMVQPKLKINTSANRRSDVPFIQQTQQNADQQESEIDYQVQGLQLANHQEDEPSRIASFHLREYANGDMMNS